MKLVKGNTATPEDTLSNKTKKMDRREFLTSATRIIIPTLGIMGLSLINPSGRARADCPSTCTGTCYQGCAVGCYSCVGSCFGGCQGGCTGSS